MLADLPNTRLWRVDARTDYGVLDKTARWPGRPGQERRHWPHVLRVIASAHTRKISAHDMIRVLQHDGRLTGLGEAVAHYGRIFKTLHVLTFADDPDYWRNPKGMRTCRRAGTASAGTSSTAVT
ncbi:Tn3 family transposase [Micromonospora olivasterospora]|uniref:Tn3 transposase DDE domain-containing protein n=1 Tax=Micromonospora olivasterospora TaxID=1880 RepID=A0A562IDR9_MICOL|nr:Tn3 family transposase [Micromonospora olivasterospora]TWH68958.1 Tn3 transposase DDE domain-containing protein [Micromonospora olivasterospora]